MRLFDYFRSKDKSTASVAKERLQIVVAHERRMRTQPDYLPQMQRDIIEVIRKYVPIEGDDVNINLDSQNEFSILELNVTLPEDVAASSSASS